MGSPTMNPVDSSAVDCNGVPGGPAVEDACGVCDGDDSSCADCNGVPNGISVEDACGVCDGDGSSCAPSDAPPAAPGATSPPSLDCTQRNYLDSKAYCASIGKQLASFHSQDEFDEILNADGEIACNAYIGAYSNNKGFWRFEDGTKFWSPAGPKATDGLKGRRENKIVILTKGKWVDWGKGKAKMGVLCQDIVTTLDETADETSFQMQQYSILNGDISVVNFFAFVGVCSLVLHGIQYTKQAFTHNGYTDVELDEI